MSIYLLFSSSFSFLRHISPTSITSQQYFLDSLRYHTATVFHESDRFVNNTKSECAEVTSSMSARFNAHICFTWLRLELAFLADKFVLLARE